MISTQTSSIYLFIEKQKMHSLQDTLHNARKTSLQQYHMPSKQTLITRLILKTLGVDLRYMYMCYT